MSNSLLKKSIKLLEEDNHRGNTGNHKTLRKHRKNIKQVIQRHKNNDQRIKKNIEENLHKLKLLNSFKVSSDVTDKIVRHVNKDFIPLESKEKKEEERTAFTEEDFEAFERDYQPDD